jgi:hypothetical protein
MLLALGVAKRPRLVTTMKSCLFNVMLIKANFFMIWIGKTCPKSMFSLSMLLTSLQILQYFLCQSNYRDIGVTSRHNAVTLKNMEKSVEPHQRPLYWRKHRSRCRAFDLITCKPMTLIFQASSNVLTYLPLQPFASLEV